MTTTGLSAATFGLHANNKLKIFQDSEDADEAGAEHDQYHGPREQGDRREVPPQVRVLSVPALTLNCDSIVGSV